MEKALLKDRLKEAMILRNLKQVDLVERGNFDKGQLSSWLSGKYKPRQINIDKLAEILNIDEAWLMGYDVPMKRKSDEEKVVGKTKRRQEADAPGGECGDSAESFYECTEIR